MNKSITDKLLKQNPWWMDEAIRSQDYNKKRRNLFFEFLERVTKRDLITGLVGLRRVGKSTLIRQVIDNLLDTNTSPDSILYYLFEEESEKKDLKKDLKDIVEYQISKNPNKKSYLFLDEIQYVDGWNSTLKYYFDIYPHIKFVVSGSSSLFIHTKATESLAGRIQILNLKPMGYGEYLRLNDKKNSSENFRKYLSWGELPYLESLPGWSEKKEYINDFVIKKIVENDLPKLKKVYGTEISEMAKVLIDHPGQIVEIQNLAHDLNIAQNTARNYLDLLEKTNLVSQIFNLGIGFRTRSLRQRKVYPSSVNSVVLRNLESITSEIWQKNAGDIIETFVFNHLGRKNEGKIYFWRQRQVKEVDFIISSAEKLLPVEVKYQNQIRSQDLANLVYYCQKQKITNATVVTKDDASVKKISNIKIELKPANFLLD